jgi:hypothetical protein
MYDPIKKEAKLIPRQLALNTDTIKNITFSFDA